MVSSPKPCPLVTRDTAIVHISKITITMKNQLKLTLALMSAVLLSSCGGGGGAGSISGDTNLADGTVAVGAPIAGALVTARDVNGKTSNTVTADAEGKYSRLNLSGLTAPIIIDATGELGQMPVKLSTPLTSASGGTTNVTPLTTALSAMLAGGDPAQLTTAAITPAKLTEAKQKLAEVIAPVAKTVNVSSDADPVTTAFVANSTGVDQLLDALDIRYRSGAIVMSNRLQKVQEGQSDSDLSSVRVTFAANNVPSIAGTLPEGASMSLSWLTEMASKVNDCFALSPSQRVSYADDVAGTPIASALHPSCTLFLHSDYLTNSYDFKQRWVYALKDAIFNNSKFKIQLRYVVENAFAVGDDAYVVNLHFKDSDGNGYTRPEVVRKVGTNYVLYGNQRTAEAYVEPVITRLLDHADSASSGNRIEGRLRFVLTPHRDFNATTKTGSFNYGAGNKALPVYACAWVTGLGLPGDGVLGADGKPRGGVLIKVPRSDYVTRQDYMAVHAKFADNFDPVNTLEDRKLLLKACAAREFANGAWEVSTFNTNNQFTLDAAKIDGNGIFTWPTSSALSWPSTSTGYSGTNGSHRTATYRVTAVTDAVKVAYRPTVMPTYTFYAFKHSALPTNLYTSPTTDKSTPIISNDNAGQTATNTFFDSALILKSRMVGAMPYLETNANGVYTGNSKFSAITTSKLDIFLGQDAPAIPNGGTLDLSWVVEGGGTGVDRVGYSCWANWINNSNDVRWGPSSSSNSWGFPRSVTSKVFTLEEECESLSARVLRASAGSNPAINSSSKYREVWTRGYDAENRQIQGVAYAKR
jgi:hypothetical protein